MANSGSLMRLERWLRHEPALVRLLPEAERIAALNRRLERALPPALARQCRVAIVRAGVAWLHCANGSAASRVRSQARRLAADLSSPAWPIDSVRVRVCADWGRPARPPKPGIGRAGLAAWRALGASLPEGALKAAVTRLLARQGSDEDSPPRRTARTMAA